MSVTTQKKNITLVYVISILFILLNGYFIANESFYVALLPFAIMMVLFAFFSLDKLLMSIVFLTPLSVPLKELIPHLDFDMALPTEPLLFGVLIIFILKTISEKKYDIRILKHPVSIAIYINLAWMFITSVTSSMPLVSFKFLASRLWFLASFYFLATQLFRNYANIKRYVWLYAIPFLFVIIYTIIRHYERGLFDHDAPNWAVQPFSNDHTSYAVVLAMFIPVLFGFIRKGNYSNGIKILIFTVSAIYLIGVVLSYTRAAWLSLVGAGIVWIIVLLKIKFKYLFATGIITLVVILSFWTQIMLKLEQNHQDSSQNMTEHIESISNVSSDASNLERINRWACAIRMFADRPVFGFGPGTYMFQYAPYQLSNEKTIISTNAHDGGNAHSEYIGPMAESGLFGSLSFIIVIIMTIITGLRVYHNAQTKEIKMLSISLLLGLITYYFHGFLNNFLDTDKASAPFWGFTAIIVALDVYYSKTNTKELESEKN